jgi:DNA processing protein
VPDVRDLCLVNGDAAFPSRLVCIPDPPAQLWVRGSPAHLPGFAQPSIAIVGSRSATRDGLDAARRIATGLARAGVVIVSGLARGIDAVAHQSAVDAGGCTVAVLGSGLLRMYPPEHAALADRMLESGAVISEYEPDTPPHPGLFPRRNRLVSGLADAVLVVEAPERSGALITAGAALDQGKDVFVVPGRVGGRRNRGGHVLIRDGARLVDSEDDLLLDMGWAPAQGCDRPAGDDSRETIEFTVDDIVRETGELPQAALSRLLQEELAGDIRRIGSARFLRVRRRVLT